MKDKRHIAGLFAAFFRIGLFTFGGGYAMLPMIQREVTEKHKWATEEEVLDCYAIGQSTPGIIAINTATFIGYKTGGIPGALAATLGMVAPSLIIITALSALILKYRDNIYVGKALLGIQGAVVALIAVSIIKMAKKAFFNVFTYILGALGFILLFVLQVPAYYIIAGALLFSVIYTIFKTRRAS
ncbi:MAG TPA: chromate transporter [Clostridia bacterium]|nr:chromate transporter [Clostridia bacterium]HPQ47087.1 chromate transporter [Clostridia bacterium]